MISQLKLGELSIRVERKSIKTIRLSVHPPDGLVKVSAPLSISLKTIREFLVSKQDWINKHRQRFEAFNLARGIEKDVFYFQGRRYFLKVVEHDKATRIELVDESLVLFVRASVSLEKRLAFIEAWYRKQLKSQIALLVKQYEGLIGVEVRSFGIRKMKTKWGTCNITQQRIWLNLELIKKPPVCLEYVVVHEMVHLLERYHNARFKGFMDGFLPDWRERKVLLNSVVGYE